MRLKFNSHRVLAEIKSTGNRQCSLTYLADTLDVSIITIRRRTAELEQRGMITRTRPYAGVPYTYRITEMGERQLG
jgi:DeoR/GlpR family transcriptional regulator of sugar metabolism